MSANVSRTTVSPIIACALIALSSPAYASTIWTDWTSVVAGNSGSATGALGGVAVSYSGEVLSNSVTTGNFTSWAPDSSFIGGTVTSSPSTVGDIITLAGVSGGTNTLTFSTSVSNPFVAIWSLGSQITNTPASFTFGATPTFQAGGPTNQFGGGAITIAGNTVNGFEGNGVVQFSGTFSTLSWTNTAENFYGFTVGVVPEPSTGLLLGLGLTALSSLRRSSSQHQPV